jgi:hypothetical protein
LKFPPTSKGISDFLIFPYNSSKNCPFSKGRGALPAFLR